jgi:hypothetical protein
MAAFPRHATEQSLVGGDSNSKNTIIQLIRRAIKIPFVTAP